MQAIEDVIIKSIFACSQSIVSACKMFVPNQSNCFELYGFDILIDNTLRPWLLEVNLSPSLGIDTPLDTKVKSAMLTDLLTLVGIPVQSPTASHRTAADGKVRFKSPAGSVPASSRRPYVEMKTTTTAFGASKRLNLGLSAEENRVLRNVRAQHSRRGGFIRIFPTQDSMQRYGMFLDSHTGIPMSIVNGISMAPVLTNHNFNMMLHSQLYSGVTTDENNIEMRMMQYERTLVIANNIDQIFKSLPVKSQHQAQHLRKQLQKAMENGNELTLLQARKIFSLYMECVLKRLTQDTRQDTKNQHEKFILKFITRSDLTIKPPSFMRHPNTSKIQSKDRTAIVAKLLGDYLEAFEKDSEMCVDNYSYYGLISSQLFDKFILEASESDLEFILTLHVNLTQNLSFLYNRCTSQSNMPTAPPIPTGTNGFLKALPSMTPNITTRDLAQIDSYYRSLCPISSSIERDLSCENLEKITTNRMGNASMHQAKKRTSVA